MKPLALAGRVGRDAAQSLAAAGDGERGDGVGIVLIASALRFGFNDEDDALWFVLVMDAGESIAAGTTRLVYDEDSPLDATSSAEAGAPAPPGRYASARQADSGGPTPPSRPVVATWSDSPGA